LLFLLSREANAIPFLFSLVTCDVCILFGDM
jgi:hypothetical protein